MGFSWTGALDLESRDGRRACERGHGTDKEKRGFRLAEVGGVPDHAWGVEQRRTEVPASRCVVWLLMGHEGDWVVNDKVQASSRLKVGSGCGLCTFDLSVPKTDTQRKLWASGGGIHVLVQPWYLELVSALQSGQRFALCCKEFCPH